MGSCTRYGYGPGRFFCLETGTGRRRRGNCAISRVVVNVVVAVYSSRATHEQREGPSQLHALRKRTRTVFLFGDRDREEAERELCYLRVVVNVVVAVYSTRATREQREGPSQLHALRLRTRKISLFEDGKETEGELCYFAGRS